MSYRARLTWIGLWTYVDDEGRGIDSARIIKGDLWPLEDDVTWEHVEADLTELSRSALVTRYTVDGRDFLAIPKWLEHQVISRPTPSKFPAPDPMNIREPAPITEVSRRSQRANTAGSGTGNREVEGEMELSLTATATFDDFYEIWPRKAKRPDAFKAWKEAIRKSPADLIVGRASEYAAHPYRPVRQFVPYPATWLRGEGWKDPMPEPPENERRTHTEKNVDFVAQLRLEQEQAQKGITA